MQPERFDSLPPAPRPDDVMAFLGSLAGVAAGGPKIQPAAEAMARGLTEEQQEQLHRQIEREAAAAGVHPTQGWLMERGAEYRTQAVELKSQGRISEATTVLAGYYALQAARSHYPRE